MSVGQATLVLAVGLLIGGVSGMVGIGGGILVIPVLMIGFGFSQARANGTSLAMLLPPVGALAVVSYARSGAIDWRFAGLLAAGFVVGAAVGATAVNRGWVSPVTLRVLFATLLLYVAGRTLFRPGGQARAAVETAVLVAGFTLTFAVARRLGRHWADAGGIWGQTYRRRIQHVAEYDYEI